MSNSRRRPGSRAWAAPFIALPAAPQAARGIDLIVEYIAGFSFGLFIFQSLFMKKMMGGTK
jgi:hypothetical protein